MNKLKQKFGLTSDKAGDAKAAVYGSAIVFVILERVSDAVTGMDAGWDKTLLLVLVLAALTIISWLTVSSAAADDPGEPPADRQLPEDPAEIVRRGRE